MAAATTTKSKKLLLLVSVVHTPYSILHTGAILFSAAQLAVHQQSLGATNQAPVFTPAASRSGLPAAGPHPPGQQGITLTGRHRANVALAPARNQRVCREERTQPAHERPAGARQAEHSRARHLWVTQQPAVCRCRRRPWTPTDRSHHPQARGCGLAAEAATDAAAPGSHRPRSGRRRRRGVCCRASCQLAMPDRGSSIARRRDDGNQCALQSPLAAGGEDQAGGRRGRRRRTAGVGLLQTRGLSANSWISFYK
jgi:hypothetical protein